MCMNNTIQMQLTKTFIYSEEFHWLQAAQYSYGQYDVMAREQSTSIIM